MNADVVSHGTAMHIRRATVDDAEALSEIGARTFFETFAAASGIKMQEDEALQQNPKFWEMIEVAKVSTHN